jgi:hypothetical protein
MQICTLPITLKGLPKDAHIIDKWHDDNICDGTENCKCKEDVTPERRLSKTFYSVLVVF